MSGPGEFIGQRVGRFTITSHLATGGMAELFIARQEALGGFEKSLVLKMLQERYASNPRVVEMFLTEARLAAKLNHQNIVHVYDVDEADGIRYIAMEYIHGETVTDIVRRAIGRGGFLPLEHALHIVAETAAGLAFAHGHRDPEGRPARIVHRDVSPSNVLVTYEGLTKIVDFGIARVQDQIREESGMRPGKVSYMSPEQVRGEATDNRSDIFSLGIILYEITVGRRLWRGAPEEVMRRIIEEQIPPPTYVRRDYPPALELIVMKALERRPADRHQSAADLQHELHELMEQAGLKSGARRLSRYMKDLFAPDATGSAPSDAALPRPAMDSVSVEVGGGGGGDPDDSEELDFDRRAPLLLRVEARSEAADPADRDGPAAVAAADFAARVVPSSSSSSSAAAGPARRGRGSPPARPEPRPLRLVALPSPGQAATGAPPAAPGAATPTAAADDDAAPADSLEESSSSMLEFAAAVAAAVGRPRQSVSFPAAVAPRAAEPSRLLVDPTALGADTAALAPAPSAEVASGLEATPRRGSALGWVALVVLAAVVAVVFMATR